MKFDLVNDGSRGGAVVGGGGGGDSGGGGGGGGAVVSSFLSSSEEEEPPQAGDFSFSLRFSLLLAGMVDAGMLVVVLVRLMRVWVAALGMVMLTFLLVVGRYVRVQRGISSSQCTGAFSVGIMNVLSASCCDA